MTAEAVFNEMMAPIREAVFLQGRISGKISILSLIAPADLADALTNLAGGCKDSFSLRTVSDELFAMDEQSRSKAIRGERFYPVSAGAYPRITPWHTTA